MYRILMALAIACGLPTVALTALAAPPPIEAYGKLPAIDLMSLSPSGDHYAFVSGEGADRRLCIATSDNKPVLIITIGAVKVRDLIWAGDDYLVVYKSKTEDLGLEYVVSKHEDFSANVINIQTKKQFIVFSGIMAQAVEAESAPRGHL